MTLNATGGVTDISYEKHKAGSVGLKNPAVARYDPTGLRSTMTASWKELDAAVLKNALPDHFPTPVWVPQLEKLNEECERKGIPYRLGKRYVMKCDTPIEAVW